MATVALSKCGNKVSETTDVIFDIRWIIESKKLYRNVIFVDLQHCFFANFSFFFSTIKITMWQSPLAKAEVLVLTMPQKEEEMVGQEKLVWRTRVVVDHMKGLGLWTKTTGLTVSATILLCHYFWCYTWIMLYLDSSLRLFAKSLWWLHTLGITMFGAGSCSINGQQKNWRQRMS